ncbi:hypothetical protein [Candidatus Neptunochlamydia vexilliferae]|uniref:hypothetical protein n=1 Tax=Candidatus Neptunichlamydia vexilliferae TaxID=1651774 RepID=UPI001890EDAC|nr:hypothetical protein [Candidatus Neptunochlamydia vexilliferae]
MVIEGATADENLEIFIKAKKTGEVAKYPLNKNFGEVSLQKKVKILKLKEWAIEPHNTIGSDPSYEKVDRLLFYKSSTEKTEGKLPPGLIETYHYFHAKAERRIHFLRREGRVVAKAEVKDEPWQGTSTIDEKDIVVETASNTEKLKMLCEARAIKQEPNYPTYKTFAELSYEEKEKIIKNLEPEGPWRISLKINIDNPIGFERPVHIEFFRW